MDRDEEVYSWLLNKDNNSRSSQSSPNEFTSISSNVVRGEGLYSNAHDDDEKLSRTGGGGSRGGGAFAQQHSSMAHSSSSSLATPQATAAAAAAAAAAVAASSSVAGGGGGGGGGGRPSNNFNNTFTFPKVKLESDAAAAAAAIAYSQQQQQQQQQHQQHQHGHQQQQHQNQHQQHRNNNRMGGSGGVYTSGNNGAMSFGASNSMITGDNSGGGMGGGGGGSKTESAKQQRKRGARDREVAKEARRRKKEKVSELEDRVSSLESENLELRLQLKVGKETVQRDEQERSTVTEMLSDMIQKGASNNEFEKVLVTYVKKFSDYGSDRTRSIAKHMEQLERLLLPTQVSKMCMWALLQDDDFYSSLDNSTGFARNGLWAIICDVLEATEEQKEKIKHFREDARRLAMHLRHTFRQAEDLRRRVESKNHALAVEMKELQSVLTAKQLAKFILWVNNNPTSMAMLDQLWNPEDDARAKLHERAREGMARGSNTAATSSAATAATAATAAATKGGGAQGDIGGGGGPSAITDLSYQ